MGMCLQAPFHPSPFSLAVLGFAFLHPVSSGLENGHESSTGLDSPSAAFPEIGSFFSFILIPYPAISRGEEQHASRDETT